MYLLGNKQCFMGNVIDRKKKANYFSRLILTVRLFHNYTLDNSIKLIFENTIGFFKSHSERYDA